MAEAKGSSSTANGKEPLKDLVYKIIKRKMIATNAKLSATGTSFDVGQENLTPRTIADECWTEHPEYPVKIFHVVIEKYTRDLRIERAMRAKAPILNAPQNDGAELARFVQIIAHKETSVERLKYYEIAFRQLIWQVKRRMRGLPSAWEIMVVMHSKQGSGKSSAVAKFGRILEYLYMPMADFSLFSDKFRVQQLCHNYLICLDEMGRASKTDINTIKQVITSPTVQARAIYSSAEQSLQRNASFIATTNYPITHSIVDTSGMRRFVEIHCRDEAYTPEWGAEINGINFAKVWACETGERKTEAPRSRHTTLFDKFQGEMQTVSDLEYFLQTHVEITGNIDDEVFNHDLYLKYVSNCRDQQRAPLSKQFFARELKLKYNFRKIDNKICYRGIKELPDEKEVD